MILSKAISRGLNFDNGHVITSNLIHHSLHSFRKSVSPQYFFNFAVLIVTLLLVRQRILSNRILISLYTGLCYRLKLGEICYILRDSISHGAFFLFILKTLAIEYRAVVFM